MTAPEKSTKKDVLTFRFEFLKTVIQYSKIQTSQPRRISRTGEYVPRLCQFVTTKSLVSLTKNYINYQIIFGFSIS
jgi:hypothetical protein